MRIELHIERLVADDLCGWSPDELAAAVTHELRRVLARDLGRTRVEARRAISVPWVRTGMVLPTAGGTAPAAGRAIGAAIARAVSGDQVVPRAPGAATIAPPQQPPGPRDPGFSW